MKKKQLSRLALIGIMSGTCVLSQGKLSAKDTNSDKHSEKPAGTVLDDDPNQGNMNYHLMTEDELLLELNEEGEKIYNSLDAKGKELARKVASQYCNGTNECKYLNACKTDSNSCAGQGDCKHKGKCAFSDKNLAVKVVAAKLKGKRINAIKE